LEKTMKVSQNCLASPRYHVRRYAEWVLSDEHLKESSRESPSSTD
jgi:hypothetical protein